MGEEGVKICCKVCCVSVGNRLSAISRDEGARLARRASKTRASSCWVSAAKMDFPTVLLIVDVLMLSWDIYSLPLVFLQVVLQNFEVAVWFTKTSLDYL